MNRGNHVKTNFKQLSLCDINDNVKSFFQEDKPKFIELFDSFVDFSEIIPSSFYDHYYSYIGRHRDFSLESILYVLIIQKILFIPTTQPLIYILNLSKELKDLCVFSKVPDPFQFSRFKSLLLHDLEYFFHNLVIITEFLCLLQNA